MTLTRRARAPTTEAAPPDNAPLVSGKSMIIDLNDEEITILLNLIEKEMRRLEQGVNAPAQSALYPLLTRMTNTWRGLDLLRPVHAKLVGGKRECEHP